MSDCDEYALDLIEGLDFLVAHGRMVLASDEEPYGRGRWAKWVKR